ncbi:TetR/AcrR family transcriptional regulator [Acetobacter fallax]|uniref:TetR family transcriptional regulator n=1 Tax=Acetobacter fallax TaxID=1737473 RepID=A0ABX0KCK6_9PROT|nr:TetR/AcrR family transcriptional regulator [Acetobacter fallax]NHO33725.1 TetR family transcriptional regulator [Acetobacter fallax]NHO37286.1 TetR family transcriptional regulator [Acetobacter fallax]
MKRKGPEAGDTETDLLRSSGARRDQTTPCEDDQSARRQQILTGAGEIFAECGYEGASMSHIARRAGVSKGTLYNYFDSKAALFAAFVKQKACQELPHAFRSIREDLPPRETLLDVARAIIALMTSPMALMLYRIVVSEAAHFPLLAQAFWENGPEVATRTLARWLTDRAERGQLRIPDPVFAAEQFFALCQTRVAMRRRLQLPVDTSETEIDLIATSSVDMFLSLYRTG